MANSKRHQYNRSPVKKGGGASSASAKAGRSATAKRTEGARVDGHVESSSPGQENVSGKATPTRRVSASPPRRLSRGAGRVEESRRSPLRKDVSPPERSPVRRVGRSPGRYGGRDSRAPIGSPAEKEERSSRRSPMRKDGRSPARRSPRSRSTRRATERSSSRWDETKSSSGAGDERGSTAVSGGAEPLDRYHGADALAGQGSGGRVGAGVAGVDKRGGGVVAGPYADFYGTPGKNCSTSMGYNNFMGNVPAMYGSSTPIGYASPMTGVFNRFAAAPYFGYSPVAMPPPPGFSMPPPGFTAPPPGYVPPQTGFPAPSTRYATPPSGSSAQGAGRTDTAAASAVQPDVEDLAKQLKEKNDLIARLRQNLRRKEQENHELKNEAVELRKKGDLKAGTVLQVNQLVAKKNSLKKENEDLKLRIEALENLRGGLEDGTGKVGGNGHESSEDSSSNDAKADKLPLDVKASKNPPVVCKPPDAAGRMPDAEPIESSFSGIEELVDDEVLKELEEEMSFVPVEDDDVDEELGASMNVTSFLNDENKDFKVKQINGIVFVAVAKNARTKNKFVLSCKLCFKKIPIGADIGAVKLISSSKDSNPNEGNVVWVCARHAFRSYGIEVMRKMMKVRMEENRLVAVRKLKEARRRSREAALFGDEDKSSSKKTTKCVAFADVTDVTDGEATAADNRNDAEVGGHEVADNGGGDGASLEGGVDGSESEDGDTFPGTQMPRKRGEVDGNESEDEDEDFIPATQMPGKRGRLVKKISESETEDEIDGGGGNASEDLFSEDEGEVERATKRSKPRK